MVGCRYIDKFLSAMQENVALPKNKVYNTIIEHVNPFLFLIGGYSYV